MRFGVGSQEATNRFKWKQMTTDYTDCTDPQTGSTMVGKPLGICEICEICEIRG